MPRQQESRPVRVSASNVGGIESEELVVERGVTLLVGRNATNRTSFLRAIADVLGGPRADLKSDAEEGTVELEIDGDSYTRRFERRNGATRATGEQYTEDADLVELFGCLLRSNPVRQAVERDDGSDLREILMRPIDTDDIRREIRDHQRRLQRITDRLETVEERRGELPALEERRAELREDLDATASELEAVRDAVEEHHADVDAAEAAQAITDELQEVREEREDVRARLETQRNAVESLRDEREELADALDGTAAPDDELAAIEDELDRLQQRERELENGIADLVSIVEFNENLVDGTAPVGDAPGSEDAAAALDPASGTVECWTCGTAVEREEIRSRLDELRDVVDERRTERNELRARIEERRSEASTLRERIDERDELREQLADVEEELRDREGRIEGLEEREAELTERIEELEAEATETEELRDSDLLDSYRRLSELEYERGQLEQALEETEREIAEREELADERADLEAERAECREELDSLRTRVEDHERAVVETFNDHIETVLSVLEYENVERVWLERKTGDGDPGTTESTFESHVVRETADGAVYEDSLAHLSESEREVIGLVVALAGYLVYDIHDSVPMMLLDSLEAIDADRIAKLVEYFREYPPYLVAAVLPGDARALDDGYRRIVMDAPAD